MPLIINSGCYSKFALFFLCILFNGINSLDDYFSKCNNINDIIRFARDDIGKLVMFSEDDDTTLPFEERFRIALADTQYMVDEE